MNMSSRNVFILANRNLRHFSGKSAKSAWVIVPRAWREAPLKQPDDDALNVKMALSVDSLNAIHKANKEFYQLRKNISVKDIYDEEEETLSEILKEEEKSRGSSVSTAQYLLFNGASVRFSGYPDWIRPQSREMEKIPHVAGTSNYLEAIELSELPITYTTLRGVKELNTVTSLYVHDCPNFDNWCLDYLTGNLPALETLNISGCPLITGAGLGPLHRLRNLRELKLEGLQTDPEMELMCILLEDYFKDLSIEGVTYSVDQVKDVSFNEDQVKDTC